MRNSKLSDWFQIAGFVGVVAGLLLVAFEMRQANKIAKAEAVQATYEGFDAVVISGMSTDIYELYVKAWTNPDNLTHAESMRLSDWLALSFHQYDKQLAMQKLGLMPFDAIDNLLTSFDFYFGNQFSRDWYAVAKAWMELELVEAIDRELEVRPVLPEPP